MRGGTLLCAEGSLYCVREETVEYDESALIERAKRDPEAFGELYRRYVDRIYSYHYRHTGDVQEAEDLTSRTFFRALRALPRYRERGLPFQAWLFRIAHNLVANWYRDRSRRRFVALEDVPPLSADEVEPHHFVEQGEAEDCLLKLVARLPEDRKTLLILKFVEQMSNAEIGAILNRSEGAVKALYHRTLLALRRMIEEEGC